MCEEAARGRVCAIGACGKQAFADGGLCAGDGGCGEAEG